MAGWRKAVGLGLLIAAIVVPAILCAVPLIAPSVSQRPFYLAYYIAPFALGFLLWARRRVLDSWSTADARVLIDALAVGLSALRLAGPVVPPSGHMLFFVFSFLTTSSPGYRVVTLILIAETSYIKFFVWQDRRSWGYGILAGVVLGATYLAGTGIGKLRGGDPRPPDLATGPTRQRAEG